MTPWMGDEELVVLDDVRPAERRLVEDLTFDVVTVAFGLRNMESLERALGEMARVLRPGGHLLVAFQVGDEVLVTIEEPHMYDVDDAVARVDSYVVSVRDGGHHVGERRMVRIDEVGRSVATATLIASNGEAADSEAGKAAARG